MRFEHAPGLPGYGTKGVDGSLGLTGLATYFSSYDGMTDSITIKAKIIANKIMFPTDEYIAGYPIRIYQTGDQIIDRNGRVFQIDFNETNLYKTTGQQLNTSGFFEEGNVTLQTPVYTRWANSYTSAKLLIDVVYASVAPGNYVSNPSADNSIYGIAAQDFAQVKFVDNNTNGYHPFTIYVNTNDVTKPERAIAWVKEDGKNVWHLGNKDAGSIIRDVSLYLDFKDLIVGSNNMIFYNNNPVNIKLDSTTSSGNTFSILGQNATGGKGGNLLIQPGSGSGLYEAGDVSISGGTHIYNISGDSKAGDLNLSGGYGDYDGGNVRLFGGYGYQDGGSVSIKGGSSNGVAGIVNIDGGSALGGNAGANVYIRGGSASARGGNVYVDGGDATTDGSVYVGTLTTRAVQIGTASINTWAYNLRATDVSVTGTVHCQRTEQEYAAYSITHTEFTYVHTPSKRRYLRYDLTPNVNNTGSNFDISLGNYEGTVTSEPRSALELDVAIEMFNGVSSPEYYTISFKNGAGVTIASHTFPSIDFPSTYYVKLFYSGRGTIGPQGWFTVAENYTGYTPVS